MKTKLKILLLILPIIILLSNTSFANVNTSGKYFALHNKENKRKTGEYYIGVGNNLKPSIKVIETNSNGNVEKEMGADESVYSLKSGNSFNRIKLYKNAESYNQYFYLDDYDSINEVYKMGLPNDKTKYNELAWILNNICIPTNELSKQTLLAMAGLKSDTFQNYKIGDYEPQKVEQDIIESIQQAAIWYFTDSENSSDSIKLYIKQDNEYKDLYMFNKQEVNDDINKLYVYLVEGAKNAVANGYNYSKEIKQSPITFTKNSAQVKTVDNNYNIGPYRITATSNDCTLKVSITNGTQELQDAKILGEDGQTELAGNSITEKIISGLGKDFYISIPTTTSASRISINVETSYNKKQLTYWQTTPNKISSSEPIVDIENKTETESQTDTKSISKTNFDLALKQYVTLLNDQPLEKSREPDYRQSDLKDFINGKGKLDNGTTLSKKSEKDGIAVNKGNKVVLTIRVYNEGSVDGNVETIIEHLPEGLELVPIEESETNREYNWKQVDGSLRTYTTDYLKDKIIEALNTEETDGKYKINYKDVQIECRVTAETMTTDTSLKVIAEIANCSNNENIADRDSVQNNLKEEQLADYNPGTSKEGKGYEDDDDYEELVIRGRYFDLSLRSFVSEVEDATQRKTEYTRDPKIDIGPLQTGETTAKYLQSKGPVSIEIGSSVVYTIRVYNEGQIDGYADEIVEHLPEELEFVNDEFNAEYGWIIDTTDTTQRTIKTKGLSKENDEDNAVKARDAESNELNYKEVKLKCKVKASATPLKEITTITEITKSSNEANLADRDNKSNASIPSDNDLTKYKGNEENKTELSDSNYYYKGQEDDDDFDKIILEKFDLALRSYISKINNQELPDRTPNANISEYNQSSFDYQGNKEEVRLCQNDLITLSIRVYNEGTQDGYAIQIGNDIPEGLEYVVDDETNQMYRWKMHDGSGNETEDISQAQYLTTSYLSKTDDGTYNNLIESYSNRELRYKEVKLVFKVTLPNSAENRHLEMKSQLIQVSDSNGGKVSDVDSAPNNWSDGEDDQDTEKIYVQYFDLSLKMIAEKTIVIEDGKEKENPTSHNFDDEKEPVVNVTIGKNNVDNTVVKFKYLIKIINEGEMEGTASEISDYIPDGLKFNQADNIKWKEVNGKIVTDQLKDRVLNPGESATIDLVLTWVNDESNTGEKINIAEISEHKNNAQDDDQDSAPNNKKEDEDDYASSTISITSFANQAIKYAMIGIGGLIIIIIGAIIIKKYVL